MRGGGANHRPVFFGFGMLGITLGLNGSKLDATEREVADHSYAIEEDA